MGYRVTQSGGLVHLDNPAVGTPATTWNLSSSVTLESNDLDKGYYNGDLGIYDLTAALDTYFTSELSPAGEVLYNGSTTNINSGSRTSYFFNAPTGVNSVSAVCIGGGGGGGFTNGVSGPSGGGGGGGGLAWINDAPVTPGNSYNIEAGDRGYNRDDIPINTTTSVFSGGHSIFRADNTIEIRGNGGFGGLTNTGNTASRAGGTTSFFNTTGYSTGGGTGGVGGGAYNNGSGSGGGGAGGYSGNGGAGQGASGPQGAGAGGGGAGGIATNSATNGNGNGGGTWPYGEGTPGSLGTTARGGSGAPNPTNTGGDYGGGGAGMEDDTSAFGDNGGRGCVRIIWPGNTRKFPSTLTADGEGSSAAYSEGFNLGAGGYDLPIKVNTSPAGLDIYSSSNALPNMPTVSTGTTSDYTGAYDIMSTYVSFAPNNGYPATGRLYIGYRSTTSPTFSGDIAIAHISVYEGQSSPTLVKEWNFAGTTTVWTDGIEYSSTTTTSAKGIIPSAATYTTINTGASVSNWTLATGTGSSRTGAAGGVSSGTTDIGTTAQTGALTQFGANYYAFVEQSGTATGDLSFMRSDQFTLNDNGYISIAILAVSNVTFDTQNAIYAYFG